EIPAFVRGRLSPQLLHLFKERPGLDRDVHFRHDKRRQSRLELSALCLVSPLGDESIHVRPSQSLKPILRLAPLARDALSLTECHYSLYDCLPPMRLKAHGGDDVFDLHIDHLAGNARLAHGTFLHSGLLPVVFVSMVGAGRPEYSAALRASCDSPQQVRAPTRSRSSSCSQCLNRFVECYVDNCLVTARNDLVAEAKPAGVKRVCEHVANRKVGEAITFLGLKASLI